jgi:hypothetical protein
MNEGPIISLHTSIVNWPKGYAQLISSFFVKMVAAAEFIYLSNNLSSRL